MFIIVWLLEYLFYRLYRVKFLYSIILALLLHLILVSMNLLSNLFIVSFGEIDIPPFIFAMIIFLTIFVFLAVLISTAKLIQSLINEAD